MSWGKDDEEGGIFGSDLFKKIMGILPMVAGAVVTAATFGAGAPAGAAMAAGGTAGGATGATVPSVASALGTSAAPIGGAAGGGGASMLGSIGQIAKLIGSGSSLLNAGKSMFSKPQELPSSKFQIPNRSAPEQTAAVPFSGVENQKGRIAQSLPGLSSIGTNRLEPTDAGMTPEQQMLLKLILSKQYRG